MPIAKGKGENTHQTVKEEYSLSEPGRKLFLRLFYVL